MYARRFSQDYLHASKVGKFILRIEDTDQARFVEGATDLILDTLDWLDSSWDEGPRVGVSMDHTFKRERRDIYKQWAQNS